MLFEPLLINKNVCIGHCYIFLEKIIEINVFEYDVQRKHELFSL